MEGTTVLGKSAIDSTGSATLSTANLSVGSHSISASYAGDANFIASASNALAQTVNKNSVSIALSSVPNPSTFGQAVTFTIHVVPSPPGGVPGGIGPTGIMTLTDGTSTLGTATLDSAGSATFTVNSLSAGAHTITASYGGDANFSEGSSNSEIQMVNKAVTQTRLTSSMNPSTNASTITLSVKLTATSGSPSGSVNFLDGGMLLGSSALDGAGTATSSISNLAIGTHVLSASYTGDSNFSASQSSSITETVVDSHSAVSLTSSANPQVVTKSVSLVATVSSPLGGQVIGGTVTFTNGQTVLASIPVVNSMASFTSQSFPVGNNQITAFYQAGTASSPFDGSATLVQSINQATPVVIVDGSDQDFSISVATPKAQVNIGDSFTTRVTLVPLHGLAGVVTTLCTGVPEGSTCAVTPNTATFDGKAPLAAALVITTTGAALASNRASPEGFPQKRDLAVLEHLSLVLGCFLVPRLKTKRNGTCILVLTALMLIGCSGTKFQQKPLHASTPPGTYTINVQAASGSLTHSAQVQLTIQ
jgi:hypothetical protein